MVDLMFNFYKCNYIEGLFLSFGIVGFFDLIMESMVCIVKFFCIDYGFKGYIYFKIILNVFFEL